MAKRRARKGEFLLVRNGTGEGWYHAYPPSATLKYDRKTTDWESETDKIDLFCPRTWNRTMPKSVCLKPGGGPIRIRVEAVK